MLIAEVAISLSQGSFCSSVTVGNVYTSEYIFVPGKLLYQTGISWKDASTEPWKMIVFLAVKMQLREASFTPGISTNFTQHDIFIISSAWLPVAKSEGNVYL